VEIAISANAAALNAAVPSPNRFAKAPNEAPIPSNNCNLTSNKASAITC
jgi:hypothetical protein